MKTRSLETKRLILRPFETVDLNAIYALFSDREVNTFLPWFPVRDLAEAKQFYETRLKPEKYCFAICLNEDDHPIGYVHMADDDSHDFGYALHREFWHRGIATEACEAVIGLLSKEGIPYITATHDRNNPRSGALMKRLGMRYCYSYQEQWQPKDIPVIFRMYQLNLDGQEGRVFQKHWNDSAVHFIELGDTVVIRTEESKDHSAIYSLVKRAFETAEHADGNEHELVNALRRGEAYLPELSLVAEIDGTLVGHIMFTKARVGPATVLALAPLSVLPEYQRQGVGTALIREGHRIARELGYGYSIVLGSETYYPRVGYLPADTYGIRAPFDVPRENFMACKLTDNAPAVCGTVQYAREFGIEEPFKEG